MNKPNIILIGGAEGTGKSTLTKRLAEHLQLPWISTDQIRRMLQLDKAEEAEQTARVWEAVVELARSPYPWEGAILEGVAIFPEFVARDLGGVSYVKSVFLIHKNENHIAQVVLERSKLPFINTKTPEQQALKVGMIQKKNKMIHEQAERYQYPCIPSHEDNTFELVLERVSKQG